ncbi:hypothetical protein MWU76_16690 [Gelidibacter sp. F2691]|nr:hypothetical protein [Gelidibacter sp. F2691]
MLTNKNHSVLYVGRTRQLKKRLIKKDSHFRGK